jgi:hypothetical protein
MNFFRDYKVYIVLFVLVTFGLTLAVNFGQLAGLKGSPTDSVLDVNGEPIPLSVFSSYYSRALAQMPSATPEQREHQKGEVLKELFSTAVMAQQAEKFGIDVPDTQVANALANVPAFQESGRFSPQAYQRVLAYQLKTSAQEFEEQQRKQIAIFKFTWLIRSVIKLTDKELEMSYPILGPAKELEVKAAAKEKMTPEELHAAAKERIWQETVSWVMGQWNQGLLPHTKTKIHQDLLQEIK